MTVNKSSLFFKYSMTIYILPLSELLKVIVKIECTIFEGTVVKTEHNLYYLSESRTIIRAQSIIKKIFNDLNSLGSC
jgi:hypothetical protein